MRKIVAVVLASITLVVGAPLGIAHAQTVTAQWVIDENALPGTSAWRIPAGTPKGISGYADRTSAQQGDQIHLRVDTKAATFHVEAYRLGYYQGLGGRLIWTSSQIIGVDQPKPTITTDGTNMVDTDWTSSLTISIDGSWVQGVYLLKLVGSDGGQGYVPFVVRDDASTSALLIQLPVTTWEAYNRWGGASLYKGVDGSFANRSRVVTFDRPYGGRGAEALLHEQAFIVLFEKWGLDVSYWTDIDLHEQPALVQLHRALISLDHDEYWSTSMRDGATTARNAGVNIAFFGANAVYRHIRMESSALGSDRHIVCYKIAHEDPLFGVNDAEVTSNWRDPPVPRPESDLLGAMYECFKANADAVVGDASSWVFAGTGLVNGDHIPGAVNLEIDHIFPDAPTPGSIEVLAHSPITCSEGSRFADMTYYSTSSKAGVFDVSSQGWVNVLTCSKPVKSKTCDARAVRITKNVVFAFAADPAGIANPSVPNASSFGYTLTDPTTP